MGSKAPSPLEEGTCRHAGLGGWEELGLALGPAGGKHLGHWEMHRGTVWGEPARAIREKQIKRLRARKICCQRSEGGVRPQSI